MQSGIFVFRFYFILLINIQVGAQVTASFTAGYCWLFSFNCKFHNTSQNANQYSWDFGNESQSSLVNPSTTYYTWILYGKTHCTEWGRFGFIIQTNYIQMLDLPTSDFTQFINKFDR